jgi:Tol biopolymer transport system component
VISPEQTQAQLGRILSSSAFDQAERARAFLTFVVTASLEERTGEIKESVIAVEALGRTTSFDPKSDPIVRVEAGRLRNRLKTYYDSEGADDPILITLPKGGYVPEFARRAQTSSPASARNPVILIGAGILGGLMLAAIVFYLFSNAPDTDEVLHLSVLPPSGSTIENSQVSPNGKMVAFTALQQNRRMLWVRWLDSQEARMIPGTERATQAFWSPDSRSLAFFGPNYLRRVELSGGPAQEICAASIPLGGGSWSEDGVIVFSPRPDGVLFRVPAAGGTPQPVTTLDQSRGETIHRSPAFLPDGRHFLYVASSGKPNGTSLRIGSLDSTDSRLLLDGAGNGSYVPPTQGRSGSLLFFFGGAVMAQPFDPDRLALSGGRTALIPKVFYHKGRAEFSVSANGVLSYQPADRKNFQLGWLDRAGRLIQTIGARNDYSALRLSPDDKHLVFSEEEDFSSNAAVWTMELARGLVSPVTNLPHASFLPVWSPDGNEILFSNGNEQRMQLLRQPLNSSKPVTVVDTPGPKFPTDWSDDGRFVTYFTPWPEFVTLKTFVVDLTNSDVEQNARMLFLGSQYNEAEAVFLPAHSSSGPHWIAYTSTETGRPEVYVRSFPRTDRKWPISHGGAWQPLWRRDGRELFFLSQDGMLMAVDVKGGPDFKAGIPHPLFRTTIPPYSGPPEVPAHAYAVSKDGQRFLVNQPAVDAPPGSISVVSHWQAAQR